MQFGQQMQQHSRQQNYDFPDFNQDGIDDRYQDPRYLAQATSRVHQQQPDMLSQLLGGATGGLMGGGGSNVLGNPLAKAAMAGIAAMAAKKMMGGGRQSNQNPYSNIRPASEDPYGDPADYPNR
jgi:hypothetical protein